MGIMSTPNGHVLTMGNGAAMVTSPMVASDLMGALSILVEAMANDLSKFTGLTPEEIIRDYYEECEIDVMTASYHAVLRKNGIEPFKTLTRTVIESKLQEEE